MRFDEVRPLFSALEVWERLIARLALLAGMRPGEIFGLKWSRRPMRGFDSDYTRFLRFNVTKPACSGISGRVDLTLN
jgi:hypothetical protein